MRISLQVRKVIGNEKISLSMLSEMLKKSAITTIRGGNRRYFSWLFQVEENLIQRMIRNMPLIGKGIHTQYEIHDKCEGEGCSGCGWSGEIGRKVSDRRVS